MVNNQGLAIALALLVVLAPAPMVSARERNMKPVVTTAEGRILYSEWVSPGDEFEIVFTHSVQRTPVIERFRVQADGTIVVFETVYQDFGAGLPSEVDVGAKVVVEPTGVRIYDMNRVMPRIVMRVGSIARHRLKHGSTVLELADLVGSGTQIEIRVEPITGCNGP